MGHPLHGEIPIGMLATLHYVQTRQSVSVLTVNWPRCVIKPLSLDDVRGDSAVELGMKVKKVTRKPGYECLGFCMICAIHPSKVI